MPAIAADALAAADRRARRRGAGARSPGSPGSTAPALQRSVADAAEHLDRLVRPGFVLPRRARRLPTSHRYVRGIEYRSSGSPTTWPATVRRMDEVAPLEERYAALVRRPRRGALPADVAEIGWLLEELRVSIFAQPVGVRGTVSPTRVGRALAGVGG